MEKEADKKEPEKKEADKNDTSKKKEQKPLKKKGSINNTIVLLATGSGFLLNAINTSIENAGYFVEKAEATVKGLEEHQDEGDIILLFLGNALYVSSDFITALKDCCYEKGKILILVGEKKELESVDEAFPVSPRQIRFERPFEMLELITKIKELTKNSRFKKRPKKILLVDDDAAFLKLVKGWLSNRYEVHIVNSGSQALDYVKNNLPDLILLDYEMPQLSGPQVLEKLHASEKTANIPVIFLTGKDDRDSVMAALEHKPERYILKTADRDTLLAMVDSFFG